MLLERRSAVESAFIGPFFRLLDRSDGKGSSALQRLISVFMNPLGEIGHTISPFMKPIQPTMPGPSQNQSEAKVNFNRQPPRSQGKVKAKAKAKVKAKPKPKPESKPSQS